MRLFLDTAARDVGRRNWEEIPAARRRRWSAVVSAILVVLLVLNGVVLTLTVGAPIAVWACAVPALAFLPFVILLGLNPAAAMKWGVVAPFIVGVGGLAGVVFIAVRV